MNFIAIANGTTADNIHDNEEKNEMAWDLNVSNGGIDISYLVNISTNCALILEAPEFISRSDDGQIGLTKVIQPEGTTARLTCLASGRPSPEIRWKKNGKILSADEYGITQ